MKNYFFAIVSLLFISACTQNTEKASGENQQSDSVSFAMKSFFKTSDECNKDTCGAYVAAKYPVFEDEKLNNFVSKVISAAPFHDAPAADIAIAADSFIYEFVQYRKEYPDGIPGYEWDQTLTVSYQDKDLINFSHVNYVFTGGAHGMQSTLFYNINKTNYQVLGLEDILNHGYEDRLTQEGEAIFRKNEGLKPEDKLNDYFFENHKFVLNQNFLITPKGLKFLYNQYEIKAYAYGTTELLIPYTAIKDLIADNGILAKYK